jgi:hypothetical protein
MMQRLSKIVTTLFAAATVFVLSGTATSTLTFAQPVATASEDVRALTARPPKRPDLADTVLGTYFGDVISDSQGSSQSSVTLYVTKVNRTTVRVASDYARLPTVDVPIAYYGNRVLQTHGAAVFVLNRSKSPQTLDFNPDGSVSFAGVRK